MDVRATFDRVLLESMTVKDEGGVAWDGMYTSMFVNKATSPKAKQMTSLEGSVVQIVRSSYPPGEEVVATYRHNDPHLPNPEAAENDAGGGFLSQPGVQAPSRRSGATIDYKMTVLLNLVCEVKYKLTLAIVRDRSGEPTAGLASAGPEMKALTSRHLPLYASPFQTNMVEKGAPFKCSFPTIYFQDHNHDSDESRVTLLPGHGLCVELVAAIPQVCPIVLFRGSVTYKTVVDRLNALGGKPGVTYYIPLVGPSGRGKGQLSVTFAAPLRTGSFFSKKDSHEALQCSLTFVSRELLDIVATVSASLRNPNVPQATQWLVMPKVDIEQMESDEAGKEMTS